MRIIFTISLILLFAIGIGAQVELDVEGEAKISVLRRTINSNDNVVRLSNGNLGIQKYQIGDFAHGGVVFWVDETGQHGLVCRMGDSTTGVRWHNGVFRVTNATSNGVGGGVMNTTLIIAQQTVDDTIGNWNFAAFVCANIGVPISQNSDWYLPSKYELDLMYQNRQRIDDTAIANGGVAFANNLYWSSSEFDFKNAYGQTFVNGDELILLKNTNHRVRGIRSF